MNPRVWMILAKFGDVGTGKAQHVLTCMKRASAVEIATAEFVSECYVEGRTTLPLIEIDATEIWVQPGGREDRLSVT